MGVDLKSNKRSARPCGWSFHFYGYIACASCESFCGSSKSLRAAIVNSRGQSRILRITETLRVR